MLNTYLSLEAQRATALRDIDKLGNLKHTAMKRPYKFIKQVCLISGRDLRTTVVYYLEDSWIIQLSIHSIVCQPNLQIRWVKYTLDKTKIRDF